jgi:hypothetical protein
VTDLLHGPLQAVECQQSIVFHHGRIAPFQKRIIGLGSGAGGIVRSMAPPQPFPS